MAWAYDADSRTLYAVSSGSRELLRFTLGDDGALLDRMTVTVDATFWFMDGVAVGEGGAVYVADWLRGSVVHALTGEVIASVTNPAGLARCSSLTTRCSRRIRGRLVCGRGRHVRRVT